MLGILTNFQKGGFDCHFQYYYKIQQSRHLEVHDMAKRERARTCYVNQRVLRHAYNCGWTNLFRFKLHAGNSHRFSEMYI